MALIPIKLLILDADGVMTTGALPYSGSGNEVKAFFVQDGGAIRLWQANGGITAIISGRKSPAVEARANDLGIHTVVQGVSEKLPSFQTICRQAGLREEEASFIGDDLLDLEPMQHCGYAIAVANAIPRVKRVARYVTRKSGGQGAIVEAVERLLRHNGVWVESMSRWRS